MSAHAPVSILHAPWLAQAGTRAIIAALDVGPVRPGLRFVGGCVRNTLLRLEVEDIDIATVHMPERVMELGAAAGLKSVATGIEHGTVTVIAHGRPFEVTTLRKDVATDGRHAIVQFTDDWASDAARRDFTMNAIYADADGALFDPVGGLADLARRKVRFIGDAVSRIREDYLRILRFFRFHAWYGEGALDAAGLAACAAEREGLKRLSGERVQKELLRLLEARAAGDALNAMAQSGILAVVLPEADNFQEFADLVRVEADHLHIADAVRRLAILVETDGEGALALADRLRLSGAARYRLARLRAASQDILSPAISGAQLRRLLYREGVPGVEDRIAVSWALRGPERDVDVWEALAEMVQSYARPKLALSGHDLQAIGLSGARLGAVLREVEEWWIAQDFVPARDAVLAKANEIAGVK